MKKLHCHEASLLYRMLVMRVMKMISIPIIQGYYDVVQEVLKRHSLMDWCKRVTGRMSIDIVPQSYLKARDEQ